ncbi:hypothetical protein KU392_02430 [Advenella alkanexedens]|uniref:Uncharacterized protein n=1 Tax=Advenella alkanexedens TaxID=1481665 RepID=A0ABS6NKG2_9BURK|nr:hypothetical protein [Advenella alkanexedens]MBV4396112.1 hypothetical protein [Advenella alkanexedens]
MLGDEGLEELLAQTINAAVELKLIKSQELRQVIVDSTVQEKAIAHRCKLKRLAAQKKKQLKRCQAIEPFIRHLKTDHRMKRCHLKEKSGDQLHAVLCDAGYKIKWLLRMIAKKGVPFLRRLFMCLRLAPSLSQKGLKIQLERLDIILQQLVKRFISA